MIAVVQSPSSLVAGQRIHRIEFEHLNAAFAQAVEKRL